MEYDPEKNPKAISLILQEDGNWKARGQRFGRVVEIREATPEAALGRLLTYDGQ